MTWIGFIQRKFFFQWVQIVIRNIKFINGTDWELINNRSFEIDDTAATQILDAVYFNDMGPDDFTSQEVTVTFQVNMTNVTEVGIVTLAGDFNGWNTVDYVLSDDDMDWIYTIDFIF